MPGNIKLCQVIRSRKARDVQGEASTSCSCHSCMYRMKPGTWLGNCRVKRCRTALDTKLDILVENPRGRLWELIITWCEQNARQLSRQCKVCPQGRIRCVPKINSLPGTICLEEFGASENVSQLPCSNLRFGWTENTNCKQKRHQCCAEEVNNSYSYKLMFVFETLRWPFLPHCLHQQVGTGGRS